MIHNQLLYQICKYLFIIMIMAIMVMPVIAQDSEPLPDLMQPVVFVNGEGTLDNFLNNILNDMRGFLLAVVAPATGLIVVGRNLGKRWLPENINSAWIEFAIIIVLFPLYHFASATNATQELQTIVDLLTKLGELLFAGGVTVVASSVAFNVAKKHDNTIFGFQKTESANG